MPETEEKTKQEPEVIDLNDLSLESSEINVDDTADAFAVPPPPPEFEQDGKTKKKYLVKLGMSEQFKVTKRKSKDGRDYLMMEQLVATVLDEGGDYDGRKFFDRPMTLVREDTGTSRVAGILKVLGVKFPARTTHVELARLLKEQLLNEPTCCVEITWGAYSAEEEKTVMKGQRNWAVKSKDENGKDVVRFVGEKLYEKSGETLQAKAEISRYLPAI